MYPVMSDKILLSTAVVSTKHSMADSESESDDSYEDKQIQKWAAEQKLHINQSTGSMELITTNI